MAFLAVTNVDGSNPGPNSTVLPDTVQMPTGNIWKAGVFKLTLTPSSQFASSSLEQTFSATGLGLLTTDFVTVQYSGTQTAGVGIVNARVSAADTLAVTFSNASGATASPATGSYLVMVDRVQPNWTAPATGNQIDW
jgi:hypothetical protein